MVISFLINDVHTEELNCTTSLLAYEVWSLGSEVWYIGMSDFRLGTLGTIEVGARVLKPDVQLENPIDLITHLRQQNLTYQPAEALDILWIRFDPTLEMQPRPWAPNFALQFAERIKRSGKLVVNDPQTLAFHSNKIYLQDFSEDVRPPAVVTRDYADVVNFMSDHPKIILKPVQGSTGKNVFYADASHIMNLRQIVDVLAMDGYFVVQQYLPKAQQGDLRVYLLDGEPIEIDGQYAILHRCPAPDTIRSNIHQGGEGTAGVMTPAVAQVIEKVKEKLAFDGMYFVGLDLVGTELLEINVNCAGGLAITNEVCQRNFAPAIIDHLIQKWKRRKKNNPVLCP